jgi:hypothetical protein
MPGDRQVLAGLLTKQTRRVSAMLAARAPHCDDLAGSIDGHAARSDMQIQAAHLRDFVQEFQRCCVRRHYELLVRNSVTTGINEEFALPEG